MNVWVASRQIVRVVRWAIWLGFLGFCVYFVSNRAPHLTQFGHLKHQTELLLFGLPLAGILAGFIELMLRSRFTPAVKDPKR